MGLPSWEQSILHQLQSRKSIEQSPFEEICSFACSMFDKVDIYKSENIQLNLQKEQLQQQLLGIQQTILAGGSDAAKTSFGDNLVDERELEEKKKEIAKLRDANEKLEIIRRTLNDEHIALTLSYKSLEKRYNALKTEYDVLSAQLLALKREDADRLNAENDKFMMMQRERMMREAEAKAGDMAVLTLDDKFDTLDDEEHIINPNAPSRVPSEIEFSFQAHEGETGAVHWYSCSGPRDDYLATGGSDRKVKIFKIADATNITVATLLGSNASITSIDVEGDAILASSNDMATRIWSVTDHKLRRTLTGHSAKVLSAKFLGAPNEVASGSGDRTVKVWDITKGCCVRTYFVGSTCYDLVYHNYQVYTGHIDDKIRCWDLKRSDNNESTAQIVLPSKITSLDLSCDGTKLLCSLRDNTIKCLDLRKMEVLQTYSHENFKISSEYCRAKFSTDGHLIACGSKDGSLYIWDTNTGRKVEQDLVGHSAPILAACWSPDGKRIVSIERGKKVAIWV